MKLILMSLFVLNSLGMAQVNLDKAYLGKTGNTLFYDLNDQNTIWVIPKYLEAKNANEIFQVGTEYRVRYNVSLPEQALFDLAPQSGSPLTFRAFRATETILDQTSDIDPILKPKIQPLGDIGMFGESIPYSIVLQAKNHPNSAKRTARHLFDGKRSYLLGRITYYFSAIRSGQPYQAQSTVAILAIRKQAPAPSKKQKLVNSFFASTSSSIETSHSTANLVDPNDPMLNQSYNPLILLNSQTDCWNKSLENVICLKDN
jgi:hypothetical protein